MAERDDDELDALLARGRLGGPTRDRILDGVLAGIEPPRRRRPWLVPAFGALAACAVLVVVLVGKSDPFRARGGVSSVPVLEVACASGARDRCASGEVLLLRAGGVDREAWLAAWAEPVGGGERVWYFPTARTPAPRLAPHAAEAVLPSGARLGPSQPLGRWQVTIALYAAPPTRESALVETPLARATQIVEVLP